MRYQVIGLENKTDGMVSVSIPVTGFVFLGTFSVDNKISVGIFVKTAYDIQHGSLTASGRTKDRYKFAFPKLQAHTF